MSAQGDSVCLPPPPPVDRMTDTRKNITLPRTVIKPLNHIFDGLQIRGMLFYGLQIAQRKDGLQNLSYRFVDSETGRSDGLERFF